MYWSAKLKRYLNLQSQPKLPTIYLDEDADRQIRSVLSKNPAIADDNSIIDAFMETGEMAFFRRGEKIIEEGQTDNFVYILVAGKVDIVFKSQLGSKREAPNQVGEMAAITPGSVRSATVVADSEEVAALKVPGHAFHNVWCGNPRFQQLLQVEMTARHRERIHASEIAKSNNSLSWFVVSVGASLSVGLIAWLSSLALDWSTAARVVSTMAAAILSFIFMLLHNPAFFWRRCAGLIILAIIGAAALDHFVTIDTTSGFGGLQISLGANGSSESIVDEFTKNISLLGALIVCAWMDRRGP